MAIMKRQFDIGSKQVWVRQASGMERLKFETILAKTFRSFKHFGPEQSEWTDAQQQEFLDALDNAGAGMDSQIRELVPPCLIDDIDINLIDSMTLMDIFDFVRGGDREGSVPLD